MKKKIALYFFCIFLLLGTCAECKEVFRRGLFVSVIQEPPVLSSRADIEGLIGFAKKAGVNTLFVQIYYANRAWFDSKIADSSPYHECVKNVSEDPLALLIKEAHASGIEVHAWLNMLSLGANKDAPFLKKYGPDILTRNPKAKRELEDYKIDEQYFLEPGDPRVRRELLGIVEEVLRSYPDLDGIQFDYIRYPDKNPVYGYTKVNIDRFKEATGITMIDDCSREWKKWKRDQVTEVLTMLVRRSRQLRKDIKVSTTGCMPYSRALFEAYQDWPSWIKDGLVDFVTVMSYSPYPDEFRRSICGAKEKGVDFEKVNIGIGAYRLGGQQGIFKEELSIADSAGAGGCVVFHYGSLLQDPKLGESFVNDKR